MSDRPTLVLMVGLPASGKTTAARRIEQEMAALRLTKDVWVKALYGAENPARAGAVIEGRLIDIALRALALGHHVVLDFGLWSRDERSSLRHAAEDLGARVQVVHCDVTPDQQRRRLDRRMAESPHTTWPMSDEDLGAWASQFDAPTPGELAGSELLDDAPTGFASWEQWRSWRWPSSV